MIVGLDFTHTYRFEIGGDGVGFPMALGKIDKFGLVGLDYGTEAEALFGVAHGVAEGEEEVGIEVVLGEVGSGFAVDVEFGGRPRTNLNSGKRIERHTTDERVGIVGWVEL